MCLYISMAILRFFSEIILAFLSVESKTKLLYVNTNFTGNLLSGFGRYCSKILPEPAVFKFFWASEPTANVFSIFFSRWPVAETK